MAHEAEVTEVQNRRLPDIGETASNQAPPPSGHVRPRKILFALS